MLKFICLLPSLKRKLESVKEDVAVTVLNVHAVHVLRKAKTTAKTTGLRQRSETETTQTIKNVLPSAANFGKDRKITSSSKQEATVT
jgi:hypothetical protein